MLNVALGSSDAAAEAAEEEGAAQLKTQLVVDTRATEEGGHMRAADMDTVSVVASNELIFGSAGDSASSLSTERPVLNMECERSRPFEIASCRAAIQYTRSLQAERRTLRGCVQL